VRVFGVLPRKVLVELAKADIPSGGLARSSVAALEEVVQREPTPAATDGFELEPQLVVTPSERQVIRGLACQHSAPTVLGVRVA
jgi:hypothetical protein